jgi:hypothetical protein
MAFTPNEQCPWVQAEHGETVKVQSVGYVDAHLSGGRLGIYVFALRRKLPVWGLRFAQILPGSIDEFATMPEFRLDMAGGSFDPGKGQRGPFKIQLGDAYVDGMGLPLNRHVVYVVTFKV